MMIFNPARCEERMVFHTDALANAIGALGTASFGRACFDVFEQSFDIDHWAVFRYHTLASVKCIATASRDFKAAAGKNVDLFLNRCHRVDPSLLAFRQQHSARPCLVKMSASDVGDAQYRHCFETTNVRERLSFFLVEGEDLLQLCIYRAALPRTFSDPEMRIFATIARLIANASIKHEILCERGGGPHWRLDDLERRLDSLGCGLSRRECQVCARAILGKTIEGTARDLQVRKTSVITYRQRAYQKLGVSRPSDIVALVCDAMSRAGRPPQPVTELISEDGATSQRDA
jgi:DNA-binding CsgD family transcriptional regulator